MIPNDSARLAIAVLLVIGLFVYLSWSAGRTARADQARRDRAIEKRRRRLEELKGLDRAGGVQ